MRRSIVQQQVIIYFVYKCLIESLNFKLAKVNSIHASNSRDNPSERTEEQI